MKLLFVVLVTLLFGCSGDLDECLENNELLKKEIERLEESNELLKVEIERLEELGELLRAEVERLWEETIELQHQRDALNEVVDSLETELLPWKSFEQQFSITLENTDESQTVLLYFIGNETHYEYIHTKPDEFSQIILHRAAGINSKQIPILSFNQTHLYFAICGSGKVKIDGNVIYENDDGMFQGVVDLRRIL